MPKPTKKSMLLVAIVLVTIGIFWYLKSANAPTTVEQAAILEDANKGSADLTPQPENSDPEITTSPADSSDSAIDSDLSVIDSQLKQLDSDATEIDNGLNDRPIEQAS